MTIATASISMILLAILGVYGTFLIPFILLVRPSVREFFQAVLFITICSMIGISLILLGVSVYGLFV